MPKYDYFPITNQTRQNFALPSVGGVKSSSEQLKWGNGGNFRTTCWRSAKCSKTCSNPPSSWAIMPLWSPLV